MLCCFFHKGNKAKPVFVFGTSSMMKWQRFVDCRVGGWSVTMECLCQTQICVVLSVSGCGLWPVACGGMLKQREIQRV